MQAVHVEADEDHYGEIHEVAVESAAVNSLAGRLAVATARDLGEGAAA
jgi:hypothetical protein